MSVQSTSKSTPSFLVSVISLGTLLEWAEYTFYGYMALTLAAYFFPQSHPQVAILKTFGVFAMGYFMRPIGAILFGHIGDKLGRKPALVGSLFLMGIATFCIGCLPVYAQIGIYAPAALLILRIFQGIAISGEYNGAGIFLIEKHQANTPCLASSWISASAAGGMVLGGIAAFCVSQPHAPDWAWRIPFLLGGLSCFIGLWFRCKVDGACAVVTKEKSSQIPLLEVLKHYKKSFLIIAAIAAFTGVFVYITNIYIVVFLKQFAKLPTHHATFFAIFGEAIVMIMIPLMAWVADKTDACRQYRMGLIGVAIFSPVIFILAGTGHYFLITLSMIIYGILNGVVSGPMVKILCDQFPPSMRYTGISFAWSLSAAIFSGTAPLVAQSLATHCEWSLGPSFYVSLIALLTYFIYQYIPSSKVACAPSVSELKSPYSLKKLTN